METNNYLFIGANSDASIFMANHYKSLGCRVFGIARKNAFFGSDIYEELYSYDQQEHSVKFDKIFVTASRTPSNGGELCDFISDNLHIAKTAIFYKSKYTKIIFFSSFSVYEETASEIKISTSYTTRNIYGISKLVTEKFLQDRAENLLILRVPVLLCPGVKNNFMSRLKAQIEDGGSFKFANPETSVNAFFNISDIFDLENKSDSVIINCHTIPDWTIQDLIDYSIRSGLANYEIVKSDKPGQFVCDTGFSQFSHSSTSLIDFLSNNIKG